MGMIRSFLTRLDYAIGNWLTGYIGAPWTDRD